MGDTAAKVADPKQAPSFRRRLLRLLVQVGAIYLGVLIVLLLLENALVYHPSRETDSWEPPPANVVVEEVWVQTPDGTRIHGWWFPCEGAKGALLYAHGNAGNLSHRGPVAPFLMQALGTSVLLFDYPGYGKSTGKPSEAGCYAATDAMYDWLTQTQHLPPENIILFGKSLGGGPATELAVRRAHRALVLVKCFTSIPDMAQSQFPFLPARWLVRNRFDNLEKIGKCTRPVVIAEAERDEMIPNWMGHKLYEAAHEPKRYFLLENSSHNDVLPASFLTGLADFLRETAPEVSLAVAN
jgi:fermentation-respiration switch protein FrsA (DUF1100 family)